jgi:hypothetical protein
VIHIEFGLAPLRIRTNQFLLQMKRTSFSFAIGLSLLFIGAAPAVSADSKPRRPNILWLVAEDFGQHLGCYGTKEVWTPNLDQLAREGVRYTRFFTTAPVCSPSRSAFMTGMYATTSGAHNHRSHRDDGYELPKASACSRTGCATQATFHRECARTAEGNRFKGARQKRIGISPTRANRSIPNVGPI